MSKEAPSSMDPIHYDRSASMLDVVSKLLPMQMKNWDTHFPHIPNASRSPNDKKKIILSGCTGFLGNAILRQLTNLKDIKEICLLVHENSGSDADMTTEADRRVKAALRGFTAPTSFGRVNLTVRGVRITERWDKATYHELADGLTDIIHATWPTDQFEGPNYFVPHLRGLLEIYNIAALAKQHNPSVRFTFLSSTDVVACSSQSPIPEAISHDPADAVLTGYAESKWMAEQLLYRLSSGSRPHPQPEVRIVRIGQLTASTQDPAWKLHQKWPLMLDMGLSILGGKWPDLNALGSGRLDWLPVNFAAKAVTDIAFAKNSGDGVVEGKELSVAHVVNCWPDGKTWRDIQRWLARPGFVETLAGKGVEIIPGHQWIQAMNVKVPERRGEAVGSEDDGEGPKNYAEAMQREAKPSSAGQATRKDLAFETRRTESLSFIMKNAKHKADMSEEMLQRILKWISNEALRYERGNFEPEENPIGKFKALGFC